VDRINRFFKTKYRIVIAEFENGFEVQGKCWYLPVWYHIGFRYHLPQCEAIIENRISGTRIIKTYNR